MADAVRLTEKAAEDLRELVAYGASPLHKGKPEEWQAVTPIPEDPKLIVQTALSLLRKWLGAGGDRQPVILWDRGCLRLEQTGGAWADGEDTRTYRVHPLAREEAPF